MLSDELSRFPGCTCAPAEGVPRGRGADPVTARAGPPLPRSVRLRGTRGRGMATPMGPAPHVTSDESGGPRGGGEGRGRRGLARRGERQPGILESWEPTGLRPPQVFTLPGPAPAGGVALGTDSCRGPTERGEKLET